jgi:hypothetical protein
MSIFHKNLTKEKWQSLPFFEQMANIGAEVGRSINWKTKDKKMSKLAFERGLELLDLTIEDKKNSKSALNELCRLREVLADYFYFDNMYGSTDENWQNYFYGFNYMVATHK